MRDLLKTTAIDCRLLARKEGTQLTIGISNPSSFDPASFCGIILFLCAKGRTNSIICKCKETKKKLHCKYNTEVLFHLVFVVLVGFFGQPMFSFY